MSGFLSPSNRPVLAIELQPLSGSKINLHNSRVWSPYIEQ